MHNTRAAANAVIWLSIAGPCFEHSGQS